MRQCLRVTAVLLLAASRLEAQTDTTVAAVAKATDLIIPSAPAFVLLGANPAKVAQPGFVEDFKLDLIVGDNGLAPDIALSVKPVWTFAYDDISLPEYRARPALERVLSTLGLSVGTAEEVDQRQLAWALKLTLFRRDPLLDPEYTNRVSTALNVSGRQQQIAEERFNASIAARREIAQIRALNISEPEKAELIQKVEARRDSIAGSLTERLESIENTLSDSVRAIVRAYTEQHWNAPAVDVALGQVYRYTGAALDSLQFLSKELGAWVTAASGFGTRSWLFTGMVRALDVGERQWQWGGNARYGGSRFNFFVEALAGFEGGQQREIAYGGEFRYAQDRKIEFGIRTEYGDDFALRRLVPVVKGDLTFGRLPSILQDVR